MPGSFTGPKRHRQGDARLPFCPLSVQGPARQRGRARRQRRTTAPRWRSIRRTRSFAASRRADTCRPFESPGTLMTDEKRKRLSATRSSSVKQMRAMSLGFLRHDAGRGQAGAWLLVDAADDLNRQRRQCPSERYSRSRPEKALLLLVSRMRPAVCCRRSARAAACWPLGPLSAPAYLAAASRPASARRWIGRRSSQRSLRQLSEGSFRACPGTWPSSGGLELLGELYSKLSLKDCRRPRSVPALHGLARTPGRGVATIPPFAGVR